MFLIIETLFQHDLLTIQANRVCWFARPFDVVSSNLFGIRVVNDCDILVPVSYLVTFFLTWRFNVVLMAKKKKKGFMLYPYRGSV